MKVKDKQQKQEKEEKEENKYPLLSLKAFVMKTIPIWSMVSDNLRKNKNTKQDSYRTV